MCVEEKIKLCKFPLKACKNLRKIYFQKLRNLLPCVVGFPKCFKMPGSRSKFGFSVIKVN